MIASPSHGSEQPVWLAIKCDHPQCSASFRHPGVAHGVFQELALSKELRALAEQNGWYVAMDRGLERDLCPVHWRQR